MKKGDYVVVTDHKGSFSGYVQEVTDQAAVVQCTCCMTMRVCDRRNVQVQ